MKLSFFGADQCVTGSCHCLEVNGKKILIDCGLQQGRDEINNRELPFAPNTTMAELLSICGGRPQLTVFLPSVKVRVHTA